MIWRKQIAKIKRRQYVHETYWGKPVPSFGSIDSQLLIVGLAPAAHGANRTGRMFTGDESGKWLYRSLYTYGFSTRKESFHASDEMRLIDTRITAMVHCAPPENKPNAEERAQCQTFLIDELKMMKNLKLILCLGNMAWSAIFISLRKMNLFLGSVPKFGHGNMIEAPSYYILGSYHPSQQNTFTKRLTIEMFNEVFEKARLQLNK
ncbi:MAG: uracil-DNA glycosylase [Bdellovibrionales bacterium]|nr:uracil-DNA glycosylase [Bdellovibrionales bacterium]